MADTTSEVTGTLTKHADSGDVTIALPHITQITDKDAVSLSEMSTMIYGAQNRFVIDLGTKRTLELSCKRANPRNYNDSSSDRSKWSNAKWWSWFIDTIDEWQNTMTTDGNPEGGFELELQTGDGTLFPDVLGSNANKGLNVYISGSLSPSFGVDSLSFTLPMVVARLTTAASSTRVNYIVYQYNGYSRVVAVPVNTPYRLDVADESWAPAASVFAYWTSGSSVYEAGSYVTLTEEYDATKDNRLYLTAYWSQGQAAFVYEAGSSTVTVPEDCNRMVARIVGGGGGAGGRGQSDVPYTAGGGGGAGEVLVKTYVVAPGTEIACTVGAGGQIGLSHSNYITNQSTRDGSSGGETSISFTDANGVSQELVAAGGYGGGYGTVTVETMTPDSWEWTGTSYSEKYSNKVFDADCRLVELIDAGYDLYVSYFYSSTSQPSSLELTIYYGDSAGGSRYESGGSNYGAAHAVGTNNGADSYAEAEWGDDDVVTITLSDGSTRTFRDRLYCTVAPSGGVPDVQLIADDLSIVTPTGGKGLARGAASDGDDPSRDGTYGGGGGGCADGVNPGLWLDARNSHGHGGDGAVSLVFYKVNEG